MQGCSKYTVSVSVIQLSSVSCTTELRGMEPAVSASATVIYTWTNVIKLKKSKKAKSEALVNESGYVLLLFVIMYMSFMKRYALSLSITSVPTPWSAVHR